MDTMKISSKVFKRSEPRESSRTRLGGLASLGNLPSPGGYYH